MCAINCSGGCPECAPEEHAAGEAVSWLEGRGWEVSRDAAIAIEYVIAVSVTYKGKYPVDYNYLKKRIEG